MIDHILVPLDGSALAECVLPHAVAVAQAFDAQMTFLRVVSQAQDAESRAIDPLRWHIHKTEAEAYLEGVVARLQNVDLDLPKLRTVVLEGQAAERIIDFTREHDVDLVVLSSHGRSGLSEWNINSVVQKVILRVYMPVMIVRAYEHGPLADSEGSDAPAEQQERLSLDYQRLFSPLDGSQRAECVLPLMTHLARFHESQIVLAHVVSRPQVPRQTPLTSQETELVEQLTRHNRQEAAHYLKDVQSRLDADVETHLLVSDSAALALHQLVDQQEVDLVILSAHGHSGEAQWPYGSIALNFIVYGTTPLLIVQDLPPDQMRGTRAEIAAQETKGHA